MARSEYSFSTNKGVYVRKATREAVNYDLYATREWALLLSFFRWYPDILEDICEGENAEYSNSLMGRVTKRYMARYEKTFTFASRGYGKTSCVVSDRCNKGILWPGTITGYYAPVMAQAAPIASKAFAGYKRNVPLLAEHWDVASDAQTSFKLTTIKNSQFLMNVPRGVDTSSLVAEECGQEERNPFDWNDFRQVTLGTNRKEYKIDGVVDPTHVNFQVHYITSASRKENVSFEVCKSIRKDMMAGGSAYALWIPWEVAVLCRMKAYAYYRNLKRELTAEQFMRECESHCTGSIENPIIPDAVLEQSRQLRVMEDKHCGDPDVFYIIGYDVAHRDVAGNALSADAVLKCERQYDTAKWDHYKKSLVYVNALAPPKSAREHAMRIKRRWNDYCIEGSMAFLVIDARQYGQAVVEALHEDLGDGLPPLCTTTHEDPYYALEREGAIPCIYPLMATGNSGNDPNSQMIDYIGREFENGNMRLLTADMLDGTSAYKLAHNIKDDLQDAKIQLPYLKTRELCVQIGNLQRKYTASGFVEAQITKHIQKDMWSALLYAARFAQRTEREHLYYLNRRVSAWQKEAKRQDAARQNESEYVIHTRPVRRMGRMAIR